MPNWVEGTLKVRGRFEDVINFLKNGLCETALYELYRDKNKNKEPLIKKYSEGEDEYFAADITRTCYINDTRRGHVDKGYISLDKDDMYSTVFLHSRFSWRISSFELREICKKYSVDMRITGFERGMEFVQEIEIVDGVITCDKEIHYDDYEWECPCPRLGG